MGDLFRDVVELLVPSALLGSLEKLFDVDDDLPDPGTVSRYRALLDGAMMLFMRRANAELSRNGGGARWMMADSSTQHGIQFEGNALASGGDVGGQVGREQDRIYAFTYIYIYICTYRHLCESFAMRFLA